MKQDYTIEQCITDVAAGKSDALEVLYCKLRIDLMGVAFAVLGDIEMAADIVQDTIIRVLETSATFDPSSNGKAWINTICRNKAIDAYRRSSRVFYADPASLQIAAPRANGATEDLVSVHGELEKFSQRDREIFIMHTLQRMTYKAIADQLDMKAGTVRSRFSRTLNKIRDRLAATHVREDVDDEKNLA